MEQSESHQLRIAALNDELSDDHYNTSDVKTTTKEAQEAEVFGLYNKALSLDKQGERQQAKALLLHLLNNPLIHLASSEEEGSSPQQLLALKYSTFKNVASMCQEEQLWDQALQYYLQALLVDESDVTVWHKVGLLALKLDHFLLASHSFQQGLLCNPLHWPCLDHSVILLYALGNYQSCLYWVSKALERDSGFVKGLALLQQIYQEQPSLKQYSLHFFKHCDSSVLDSSLSDEEHSQVVEEALQIRQKKRELSASPRRQNTRLTRPLSQYTWTVLGERLVELYDHIHQSLQSTTSTHRTTVYFSSPVDLLDCLSLSDPPIPAPHSAVHTKPPATSTLTTSAQRSGTTGRLGAGAQEVTDELAVTESEMDISEMYESEEPIPRGLGTKRRKLWQIQEEWGGKRRSSRVRNVGHRKQEESVNYQQLLTKFLPKSLLEGRSTDAQALTQELGDQLTQAAQRPALSSAREPGGQQSVTPRLSEVEAGEVREFITSHLNNMGVLELMGDFLRRLAKSAMYTWPISLCEVYTEVHKRYRKHIEYPNYLSKDDSEQYIREMSEVLLLSWELQIDRWCLRKAQSMAISPRKSPGGHQGLLGPDFPGEQSSEDMCYLTEVSIFSHILQPHALRFKLRVFWLQGKFLLLENKIEEALHAFCKILECLEESETDPSSLSVFLPNVRSEPLISQSVVESQVESLQRCQSLEEVHRLYEAGEHEQVVTLLQQTFHTGGGQMTEAVERHEQLTLLQHCLKELKQWKKCLVWSEVSLREAILHYNATSKSHRVEWMSTICQLMEGCNRCLVEEVSAVAALPSTNLIRLTQNLLWLLEMSLESVDPTEPPNPLPWILLYRLVKYEEAPPASVELPCSLMLLNFAHDCLGRRGWCVGHQGRLLQFVVDELMSQLSCFPATEPHPLKEELEEMLDQCFYCMYGHPNKRTKARHLQEHGNTQIELTWERAQCVFDYFKPKSMPEYDSYRTSTVSADLENLLKRIVSQIPPEAALTGNTIESVTSYIEGTTSHAPSITDIQAPDMLVVTQIYYLLGDYYFKNKETGKAIKFYLHDLCVNPDRFDSWAGMALARASRLEQRLNSHELKNEPSTIQKQANSALRCFRRALDVDSSNSKLWIEYAGLAFQLQSYLSRILKQCVDFPLPEETMVQTQERRGELMKVAQQAYMQAGSGEEEEEPWLQHYMLGKIAEKTGEKPEVFLEHYKLHFPIEIDPTELNLAAEYLHEERAKYPKKITYIHSPPFLSVEALEVFYRLHVSSIKYLVRREKEALTGISSSAQLYLTEFEHYIHQSLTSNFAICKEKEKPKFKFTDSGKAEQDSGGTAAAPVKVRTPTRASRLDHTYSTMSRLKQQQQAGLLMPSGSLMFDVSQDAASSSSSVCSPSVSMTSPHCYLSTTTPPLSSIASPTAPLSSLTSPTCTSHGSTPLIGDLSFSTPVSLSRLKGVLPTGITPLADHKLGQTLESAASGTAEPPTNSPKVVVTTTSGAVTSSPVKTMTCGTPTSAMPGLTFSVDSILGLSRQTREKTDQFEMASSGREEGVTQKPCQLLRQQSEGFTVDEMPSKHSMEMQVETDVRLVLDQLVSKVLISEQDKSCSVSTGLSEAAEMYKESLKSPPTLKTTQSTDSIVSPPKLVSPEKCYSQEIPSLEMPVLERMRSLDKKHPEKQSHAMEVESGTQPVKKETKHHTEKQKHGKANSISGELKSDGCAELPMDAEDFSDHLERNKGDLAAVDRKPPVGESTAKVNNTQIAKDVNKESTTETMMDYEDLKTIQDTQVVKETSVKMDILEERSKEDKNDKVDCQLDQSSFRRPKDQVNTDSKGHSQGEKADVNLTESKVEVTTVDNFDNSVCVETVKKSETKKEKKTDSPMKDNEVKCVRERYEQILRQAMQGLEMCLNRFPHHYKSLYRLAYVYANSDLFKDLTKPRDLLLGSEKSWQEVPHMPCPALFQERKNANFFQGMWRIPVEDIDRSGSFATHMAKCLRLLFDSLVSLRDYIALYQVHTALSRTPEQGKKYLRDSDRTLLARQAYTSCFDVIETTVPEIESCTEEEVCKKLLLEVHRYWQHGVRQQICVKRINQVFSDVFTAATHNQIKFGGMSVLERAIKYCSQLTAKAQPQGTAKYQENPTQQTKYTKATMSTDTDSRLDCSKAQIQPGCETRPEPGPSKPPGLSPLAGANKPEGCPELMKYLTSQHPPAGHNQKPGPEDQLEVLVLDESHIEINISPKKLTPSPKNRGNDLEEEMYLNEVTGVWELQPSSTTKSGSVKQQPSEASGQAAVLEYTPTQAAQYSPGGAFTGQLGARALMQQMVLQQQSAARQAEGRKQAEARQAEVRKQAEARQAEVRKQAEAARQAEVELLTHQPSTESLIQQMLLLEQPEARHRPAAKSQVDSWQASTEARYRCASSREEGVSAQQPSTETMVEQLLHQQQAEMRRLESLGLMEDPDCVIILSDSD